MTTIEVGGINAQSAPSPMKLAAWHQDWAPQLAGLTDWAPHPANSNTNYRCTTTATVNATEAVVGNDLTVWVDADAGHRHYSVT